MKKTILAHWMGLDSLCISAYWETHLIGCPAIQMLHVVGTNSSHIFCWPLDFDRQIFVLPQDSLLVSTICWPSPWKYSAAQFDCLTSNILHNYPSTIRNTTINNTTANNAITTRVYQIVKFLAGNIWVKLCWYQNLILTPILEAYIPQSGRSSLIGWLRSVLGLFSSFRATGWDGGMGWYRMDGYHRS